MSSAFTASYRCLFHRLFHSLYFRPAVSAAVSRAVASAVQQVVRHVRLAVVPVARGVGFRRCARFVRDRLAPPAVVAEQERLAVTVVVHVQPGRCYARDRFVVLVESAARAVHSRHAVHDQQAVRSRQLVHDQQAVCSQRLVHARLVVPLEVAERSLAARSLFAKRHAPHARP